MPLVGNTDAELTLVYQEQARVKGGALTVSCSVQVYRLAHGLPNGLSRVGIYLMRRDVWTDLWTSHNPVVRDVAGEEIKDHWARLPTRDDEAEAQRLGIRAFDTLKGDCEVFAAALQMALDEAEAEYDDADAFDEARDEIVEEATEAAQRAVFDRMPR